MRSTADRRCWYPMLGTAAVCGILALGLTTTAQGAVEEEGLVAYWPLDGNCLDATGHGNDCVVVGAAPANGKIGGAYLFDGIDDELRVLASPALQDATSGPYSMSAWVLLTQMPGIKFIIDAGSAELGDPLSDQRGLRFNSTSYPVFKWVTTEGPGCQWPGNGTAYCLTSSVPVGQQAWHHIVGVYDGSAGWVYVDGVLGGTLASSGAHPHSTTWKIGNVSFGGTGTGFFPGLIDEVRVYNRALSETEVAILARGVSADAGSDRSVDEGTLGVVLDGSGSAGEGLSFEWQQIAGSPEVAINVPASAVTGFDAPYVDSNTTLTFQLTVTNASLDAVSDTVDITVVSVNDPPIADAGDDFTIKEGATATLNAGHSYDPNNGDPLYYDWTQVSGPPTQLVNPMSPTPTFTVPTGAGQTLVFELVVSDGGEASTPATVRVGIVTNAPPTAEAGENQTKQEGATVTLNGLRSLDADGDGLSYAWRQVSGGPAQLSSPTSAMATFTAPFVNAGGDQLVFQLVVTDNDPVNPLPSEPAHVTVTVVNINDPPRCDLGRPSESILWPPNHSMTAVAVEAVSDPDNESGDVVLTITGVTQDEPVSGLENGDTSPDAVIADDGKSVLIRSERAGSSNGRVYQIVFTAFDGSESCTGAVKVAVPHNRKGPAQDEGQQYNSIQS